MNADGRAWAKGNEEGKGNGNGEGKGDGNKKGQPFNRQFQFQFLSNYSQRQFLRLMHPRAKYKTVRSVGCSRG